MKSGIYQIRNLINNKTYIGSAIDLSWRKSKHFSDLFLNKHYNKKLQNSFNKYGKENFLSEIIEYCEKEKLLKREQYYLDTLKPYYNICKIAGSRLGVKETEKHCREKSIRHKNYIRLHGHSRTGMKNSKETRAKISRARLGIPNVTCRKAIVQLDFQGNLINEYVSILDAIKKTNILGIRGVCIKRNKAAGGFVWIYKKDYDAGLYTKILIKFINAQAVIQLNLKNEFIAEYNSIKIAAESHKLSPPAIGAVCRNILYHKTAGGFRWMYKKDYIKLK